MFHEIYVKSAPVFLLILLGVLARQMGLLGKGVGSTLTKVVFYVTLPATIFLALLSLELSRGLFLLPLSAVILISITYLISFYASGLLGLEPKTKAVFVMSTGIINMGFFAYPFLILAYGPEGLARGVLFDFGNAFLAYTLAYYIAVRYGRSHRMRVGETLVEFLKFPPIWALGAGISVNSAGIALPSIFTGFLGLLNRATVPLIMFSIGLFLTPKMKNAYPILLAAFIRMGVGFLLGYALVGLFGLEGLNRSVVLLCSMMPAGANTLVFAAKEGLDVEFAASVVSLTILLGLVIVPLLIFIL